MSQDRTMSRRSVLGLGLGGVVAATALAGCAPATPGPVTPPQPVTFARWRDMRGEAYFIGHRGAAAIVPEHSLEGYQHVIDSGTPAVEVSTSLSSDGAVYCLHDPTLDRTTTLQGPISALTSSAIDAGRIRVPRLGPSWQGEGMPQIPRLLDVVKQLRGRAVLCVEAKIGAAVEPMIEILTSFDALDAVMFKCPVGSPHVRRARDLGLPVFGYLGAASELTPGNVALAKQTLNGPDDVLVVPARLAGRLIGEKAMKELRAAVPRVLVYAAHRRSEVAYYRKLGVEGVVASNAGYASGSDQVTNADSWATGRLPSGLLTNDPYSESQALDWGEPAAVGVGVDGRETFVTLGDLTPVADAPDFTMTLSVSVSEAVGSDGGAAFYVGTKSDASPEREPPTTGYLLSWSRSGRLSIAAAGDRGRELAGVRAPVPVPGEWYPVGLQLAAGAVAFSVGDARVELPDQRWRGGYVHAGRTGTDGRVFMKGVSSQR